MDKKYGNISDMYGHNPACKKTCVTFRIVGDDLIPAEISASLKVDPTRAFEKGEEYDTKKSGVRYRPIGHWSFSSEKFVNSNCTEAHAKYLLSILEPKNAEISRYLNDKSLRVCIVFWWEANNEHGGFTLSSDTLLRLCRLSSEIDYTFIG